MEELLKLVEANWRFDGNNYRRLAADMSEEEVSHFAVNHILKESGVVHGLLSSVCEESDHSGKQLNHEQLIIITRKMLVNTLRLAGVLGLSADDLQQEVLTWAKKFEKS